MAISDADRVALFADMMSRLLEPPDSNYDACGWFTGTVISEFLELAS
jgi:hypothetical protein